MEELYTIVDFNEPLQIKLVDPFGTGIELGAGFLIGILLGAVLAALIAFIIVKLWLERNS